MTRFHLFSVPNASAPALALPSVECVGALRVRKFFWVAADGAAGEVSLHLASFDG